MQFITNDEQIKKVEYQIERLSSLNILFSLSASVDGKFCDFGRTENDDEFYNKLRDFLVKYDLKIHPMVSATNIKYWKDNRNWWMNNFPPEISYDIMSLEVRNEQWDNESIQHLVNYCDYLINWNFYNRFNQNKKEFLEYVLCVNPKENSETKVYNNTYNIISLNYIDTNGNDDKISCSLNHTLNIRLADLSLGLCHRLFYPELTFGKYRIDENDEISDFETTNVSLLILKTNIKKSCLPHCENCVFQGVCPGHCLGSSYENYRNCLVPGMEVCNMYKSKLSFLIYKFYHLGLFDEEIWRPVVEENFNEFRIKYMEDLISSVLGGFGIEKQFC